MSYLKLRYKLKKHIGIVILMLFAVVLNAQDIDNQKDTTVVAQDSLVADTLRAKQKTTFEDKIDYSAEDSLVFLVKDKLIFYYKSAKIDYQDIKLKSGFIKIDLNTNVLHANGVPDSLGTLVEEPVFTDKKDEFKSRKMAYNFKTKKGVVYDVITEQSEGYIHGEQVKIYANKHMHIKNGKFTTCDLEHPHFYIGLSKAIVIPGKKIVSGPLHFVIADIPTPLALPFGFFPNNTKNTSGILIPSYGYDRRGYYLKSGGIYLALSQYVDLELRSEIFSYGSWGVSASSNYKRRYKYSGNFSLTYSKNVEGEPDLSDYKKSTSFWVKFNHRQDPKSNPNSSFSANVSFGSSNNQQYNAVNVKDYVNTTRSSSVSYTHAVRGSPFKFSLSASGTQNTKTHRISLDLPNMSFNVQRQYPFRHGKGGAKMRWYEKIELRYDANLKNTVSTLDSLLFTPSAKFRSGFKQSIPISASYKLGKFFTFNPQVNYVGILTPNSINKYWQEEELVNGELIEAHVVTDTVRGVKYAHSFDPSLSFSANVPIYGMYIFSEKAKIQAIRHVITPSVSMSLRPDMRSINPDYYRSFYKMEKGNYPDGYTIYDAGVEEYTIFDNAYYKLPRAREGAGSVNISIRNNLEMKVRKETDSVPELKKIKLIENLTFRTSYNIFADSLRWSNLTMSGSTKILNMFSITFGGTLNPYAYDSTGRTFNQFEWQRSRKLGRISRASISANVALSPMSFQKNKSKNKKQTGGFTDGYANFHIPWSLNISYSMAYSTRFNNKLKDFESTVNQTVAINGNFSPTPYWSVIFNTGFDLTARKVTLTSISIKRDLHCWAMSFTWVPFGYIRSYNFQINVKSSIFKDIKYKIDKRSLYN